MNIKFFFAGAVIILSLFTFFLLTIKNDADIYFLNSKGCISVYKNNNFSLSLGYISSRNSVHINNLNNENKITSISLGDHDDIVVRNFEIVKADFGFDNYKVMDIEFYYLNMDLFIPNDFKKNTVTIERVVFNTFDQIYMYNIGSIHVNIIDDVVQVPNKFDLKSVRGLNLNGGLKSYSANYINNTEENVLIYKINVCDFYQFKPIIYINDNFVLECNNNEEFINYIVEPGGDFNIVIDFTYNNFMYDSFYFAPQIEIKIKDLSYTIFTTHTASGLSLNTDELRQTYNKNILKKDS